MIDSPVRDVDNDHDLHSSTIQADGKRPVVASSEPEPGGEHRNADLTCRKLKLRDLRFLVSSVRQEYLDQPDSLLTSAGPLGAGLHALQPFARNRPATNLAFLGDRFAGYIQFDERGPDRRWVATNVGLASGLSADRPLLDALLEFSITRAGMRSVKRLFARVPPSTLLHEAFMASGFEPYMDETVHVLSRVGDRSAGVAGVRDQEPADTWAVHQLYHAAAPRHVQYAEAWTSNRWELAVRRVANKVCRAYVVEEGYQLIGYAGVRCSGSTAVLEVMYLPDRAQCVADFLRSVLGKVAETLKPSRIYATARGYQEELRTALSDEGFQLLADQQLMIKYTAAKVSARATPATIALPVEVRERVPKQVPTYLNRPVREETPA
jgi:hypothetical protein